jgi:hypothetical protein
MVDSVACEQQCLLSTRSGHLLEAPFDFGEDAAQADRERIARMVHPAHSAFSARLHARVAGLLYLLVILAGTFAPFVVAPSSLASDPAAITARIMHSQGAYRFGGVAEIVVLACDIALAGIFYRLLGPVSRTVAMLAAFFRLVYAAINGANVTLHFAPLLVLTQMPQPSLALTFMQMHLLGFDVALVFFGIHVALLGYLVFRSTYLPRVLGLLLMLGGAAYLANSLISLLAPGALTGRALFLLAPAGLAEIAIALWLLVVGVNARKWEEIVQSRHP